MDSSMAAYPHALALVLLATRLIFGLLFAAHGTQKLFGWFGGPGLQPTGDFFAQMGFHPGRTFAALAGATELASGLLIALGFLGPVGSAMLLSVMVVAIVTVHWGHGLLASSNGSELPLLYVTAAIGLALVGHGPYSLDALLGISSIWSRGIAGAALVAGAGAGLASVIVRRRPDLQQRT